jgi:hypothetical protein
VVNEILWVLEGSGVDREKIIERFRVILNSRVDLPQLRTARPRRQLWNFFNTSVDFQDVVNAFRALSIDTRVIISYDRHFNIIDWVR